MSIFKPVVILSLFLNLILSSMSYAQTDIETSICNDNQKIYKVCSDQIAIYEQQHLIAIRERKLLVLVFGADWCPWCNSLNKLFNEESFIKNINRSMRFQEIGIYMYNSGKKVESGFTILSRLARSNGLDVERPRKSFNCT